MIQCERKTRLSASLTLVLCAMVTGVAIAAPPTLQSVAVTPAASAISVGQKQSFKATGTFSDGSTHALKAGIANIAPGSWETCVLLIGGGVNCWGNNRYGQLGDGSTVDSLIPRPVKWITNATAVAETWEHGCAVLTLGAVRCWGRNDYGQLGNGTVTNSARSVRVTGINSATGVAVGTFDSCALLAGGEVRCWGHNTFGEMGNGTKGGSSSIPVTVTGISTATAVDVGWGHSCALLASGAVQCWGYNVYGQVGNGTTTDHLHPVTTPATVTGIDNATAVATGYFFSCALLASGAVQCWGNGDNGELGDGTGLLPDGHYASSNIPVTVAGISTAVAITAGGYHACAVLSSGSAKCWGTNDYGQLGNRSPTAWVNTPVLVGGVNAPLKLAAGEHHTCALLADGAMRCWGFDNEGQLGNRRRTGQTPNRWPVNVIGTPGVVWQSSDPTKATIGMRGLATGLAVGNTTITATTAGFMNDNAVLTVK